MSLLKTDPDFLSAVGTIMGSGSQEKIEVNNQMDRASSTVGEYSGRPSEVVTTFSF